MNHLHNAQFRPGPENSLLYFTSEGNVRWQPSSSQGHHVCVMTQTSSRQITQLNYALPIWVKDRTELHLCSSDLASLRLAAGKPKENGEPFAALSKTGWNKR